MEKNGGGGRVHYFQGRVGSVRGGFHRAERLKPLHDQIAHQWIILRQQQFYCFVPCRAHRARLGAAFRRWKSPLFPPVFSMRTMSVISIPLSKALHISYTVRASAVSATS